jgi:hypothetical protein
LMVVYHQPNRRFMNKPSLKENRFLTKTSDESTIHYK